MTFQKLALTMTMDKVKGRKEKKGGAEHNDDD